jgi:hypothetical protein
MDEMETEFEIEDDNKRYQIQKEQQEIKREQQETWPID